MITLNLDLFSNLKTHELSLSSDVKWFLEVNHLAGYLEKFRVIVFE